ncbi:MAG TPA: tripartite tricarboxylate transporter substrate binding protein [Ramlibacter sp.]|nr:tripartite tricarboxylate transporter substrate binding protein [Ramlibacter sp.]
MNRSHPTRRAVLGASLAVASLSALGQAAPFPSRPVRMMVGYPPGAGNDLIARAVSQRLAEIWKQPVVVENRAGASGSIGADAVARATPDGYTLLLTGSSHLIHGAVSKRVPYKAVDDFTPVSSVGGGQLVVEVHPSLPVNNVQELIALAKQRRLAYGSAGTGTSPHIAGEMFAKAAGVQMTHVPYKGATQAAMGVAGKEVQAAFQGIATVTSLVKAGKLKLIAVTTPRRLPQFPDVPTVGETGMPGFEFNSWFAIMAPAGTPRPIVNALSAEVKKALQDAEVREKLSAQGLTPRGTTPEELNTALRAQLAKYGALIKANNITAE